MSDFFKHQQNEFLVNACGCALVLKQASCATWYATLHSYSLNKLYLYHLIIMSYTYELLYHFVIILIQVFGSRILRTKIWMNDYKVFKKLIYVSCIKYSKTDTSTAYMAMSNTSYVPSGVTGPFSTFRKVNLFSVTNELKFLMLEAI